MAGKVKRLIMFLLQPKAIFLGAAIFLFIYVFDNERRVEEIVGCYDCGWDTRQAFYLLIASLGLLLGRLWSVVISLLASVKVIYSVGYLAFWNNMAEVRGVGRILKESLRWTYEAHPEYFVEIIIAVLIGSYATSSIWWHISRRYLSNRTASNNAMQPTAK
ncbi:MAG TPA: hypothetical protein VFQ47_04655 [Nitrososphaera sp.]|jgi:hypothetical protein|nr:hypothetical protein [Nitrososphaera sp.]